MSSSRKLSSFAILLSYLVLFSSSTAWGAVAGSISGTVKDPTGSVVANATVTLREVNTGISHPTRTNAEGYFTFPVLPVGRYELDVQAQGFQGYQRTDIVLDTDAALALEPRLKLAV